MGRGKQFKKDRLYARHCTLFNGSGTSLKLNGQSRLVERKKTGLGPTAFCNSLVAICPFNPGLIQYAHQRELYLI